MTRSYHSCFATEKGAFFVYSGFQSAAGGDVRDMWKYDGTSWSAISVDKSVPIMDSSVAVHVSPQRTYMWGGWGTLNSAIASMLEFDGDTGAVTVIQDDARRPSARFGHILVAVGPTVYLAFGATFDTTTSLKFPDDGAWQLDPEANTWTAINGFSTPNRVGARALARGIQVFVMFGKTASGYTSEVLQWLVTGTGDPQMSALSQTGAWPPARAYHAMQWASLDFTDIVVFGGVSTGATNLGDMWVYNVDTNEWAGDMGRLAACA